MFFEGKLYGKAISQSQAANSFVPRLFSSPVCLILLAYERTCFFGSLKLSKNSKVHTQERIYFLRRSLCLGDIFIKNLSDQKLELSEAVTRFSVNFIPKVLSFHFSKKVFLGEGERTLEVRLLFVSGI